MASGSHVCSGNWPLLPMMPMKRHTDAARSMPWSAPGLSAYALLRPMSKLPTAKYRMMMPIIRPMSPVRVVRNALSAAAAVGALLPPVPDQRERAEADALPAEQDLQRVVGDDEREHRRGEQAEHRVVVRVADVVLEVRQAVDVHQQRDQRDDEQHHHREAVHADADAELDAAVLPPGEVVQHRGDDRFAVTALGAEHAATEGAESALVTAARALDPVDPLVHRDAGEDERRARARRSRSPNPSSGSASRRGGSG